MQHPKPQAQPDSYVSALTDTGQCTLWREVAGQRQCLDGNQAPVAVARERAPVAAPRMAVTSAPLPQPAASPVAAVPAEPQAVAEPVSGTNLFDEMRRIGMIKPAAGASQAAPQAAPQDRKSVV